MLEEITIKDLGVIQGTKLTFTPGLTVLTGETGAGKTMVLTALSLLLGKRTSASIVRHGAECTSVEGVWSTTHFSNLDQILEVGAVVEDETLYINRTVTKEGKSRAVVGGKSTPASVLATLSGNLVNVHGQSDQIRLKSSAAQAEALDKYAGDKLTKKLTEYQLAYKEWKNLTALVRELKTNMVARQQEYENLLTAVQAISNVSPSKDEDETLKDEISGLENVEVLQTTIQEALNSLSSEEYESPDTAAAISNTVSLLTNVSDQDSQVAEMLRLAQSIQNELTELQQSMSFYLSSLDTDVFERLNERQSRLVQIKELIRKYGTSLDDVLEYWETADQRAQELDPDANNLEELEKQLQATQASVKKIASELTALRTKAAAGLEKSVNLELAGLAMAGNKLQINLTPRNEYNATGVDEVNFLLTTPGSTEPRPINKSASGGELSRIMLALEVVLADPKTTPTFVFDEVDSGVGGATAIEIGKRLAKLAREAQVIVVTHLPQVAVFADNHLQVEKTETSEGQNTKVRSLDQSERISELSRMLSGLGDSETGLAHAQELYELAVATKSA